MRRDGTIIAIHPNTSGFGYVILNEKGEVLDYGVSVIRPIQNNKCINKIQEILRYYKPNTLLIEDHEHSNKSDRVKELMQQIAHGVYPDTKIIRYTKKQIRDTFEIFGAANKFEIAKKIVEAYPQFKSKLPHKRKPWQAENYYQGLFDALTLVLTHQYLSD